MLTAVDFIIKSVLIIFSFCFPFFYLNFTFEPTEQSKYLLLIISSLLLFFLSTLKTALNKNIQYIKNSFTLPLFLIVTIYIISSVVNSPNIFMVLQNPLSASTWIFLFVFFLVLVSIDDPDFHRKLMYSTVSGTAVVSVYSILMYFNLFPKSVFTPAGNLLSTSVFILIIIIYQITALVFHQHKKNKLIPLVLLFITLSSEFILVLHLLTDQRPILLPHRVSFSILTQVLKSGKSLLLGVGPANYIAAFTLGKPAYINQTPIWNITFSSSSSFLFNMMTETGLLTGFIYIYILLIVLYSLFKHHTLPPSQLSLLILMLFLVFLSSTVSLIILMVILLSYPPKTALLRTLNLSRLRLVIYLIPFSVLVFFLLITFFTVRFYLAESFFRKSHDYLQAQNGTESYNMQKQAIKLNPYMDKYHTAVSQTSLLLADSLSKKENPSPEDLQNIPRLVSQSIEEAKTAVRLNKTNVFNWLNLSKIYASISVYARDADKWAVDTAKQAIVLDPNNPNGYITLSELYLKQNSPEEAEKYARRGLNLKNNLAKANLQLALVLIEKKDDVQARQYLENALKLYRKDSPDYAKVEKLLETVK